MHYRLVKHDVSVIFLRAITLRNTGYSTLLKRWWGFCLHDISHQVALFLTHWCWCYTHMFISVFHTVHHAWGNISVSVCVNIFTIYYIKLFYHYWILRYLSSRNSHSRRGYVCESWTVIHHTYLGFNCGAPQKFLVSLVTNKMPLTKWRIIFRLVEANLFFTHTLTHTDGLYSILVSYTLCRNLVKAPEGQTKTAECVTW